MLTRGPVIPARGEIWRVNLDPIAGHEQVGKRPALVISDTTFNAGPQELVIVLPMTRTRRRYQLHIWVEPADSGLGEAGAIMCDQIRTVSRIRFLDQAPAGMASPSILDQVDARPRAVLHLPRIR